MCGGKLAKKKNYRVDEILYCLSCLLFFRIFAS